jgi:crotonobetainyl-CoA:carnitine CoA-transferase CaiB-like acyl-CoA transferase
VRRAPGVGDADGDSVWEPRESVTPERPAGLPLAGLRVIDFTAFWAGPAATHSLAAFGADVVKIESVQRPDGIRYSGGMRKDVDDWWEYGWVFHAMNTNKRSVTLDLQSDDGIRLVKELVRHADVVIENFSPRVMEQFGLGADALLELNPRVVVVRMPAFGLTGPWRDRVGFAPTMEQIAGLAWVTGLPDGPPVAPRGACDPLAGAHAAFTVLAALEFADRTGRGQLVEVPMIETVLNVTAVQTMEFEVFGKVLERRGNRGHGVALQDIYRCAGEDDWIAVSVRTDDDLSSLAELIAGRGVDIEEWLATQDAAVVVERLTGAGIPAAVVVSPSLVTENPQLRHRGFFECLEHPRTGAGLYPCPPFARFDGAENWLLRTPPTLGQHNGEVLTELCGVTDTELDRLAAATVIGTRPKGL